MTTHKFRQSVSSAPYGFYLWSTAQNWTGGVPVDDSVVSFDVAASGNPSGYDDISDLTLTKLILLQGYVSVAGTLTVDDLVLNGGTFPQEIGADSLLSGAPSLLDIAHIAGTGGIVSADGVGAETVVSATSDPGEIYQTGSGGMLILAPKPKASSQFYLNDADYYADYGTLGFRDPGGTITSWLYDVGFGGAIELPGDQVKSVTIGASSLAIVTDAGKTTFANVTYLPGEVVSGYAASYDSVSGLEKITFTGGFMTDFQQSVSGGPYNLYLWSNASNWSSGVPTSGGGVTLDIKTGGNPSGYDDISNLSLAKLDLVEGYISVAGTLAVDDLVLTGGTFPQEIGADSLISDASSLLTIFGLTGAGGIISADGNGAETVVSAPTDPGEIYQTGADSLLILTAAPSAESQFLLNDTSYYANVGTIGFRDPGETISSPLENVAVGSAIELPGSSVERVSLGHTSISIVTNKGATTFSDVSYFAGETVTGYTAAYDARSGLEKITFTGSI